MALVLMLANILLVLAILVVFYLIFRWLITKFGLPADITTGLLIIAVILIIVYVVKNGFPVVF